MVKWQNRYAAGAVLVCAGLAIAVSVPRVSAQDDAGGKPEKIAVFNRKTVFDNYEARKVEEKALQDAKNSMQTELDKQREQINASRKKLREDKSLSEQQRQELADKVAADERDYEDKWRRAQGEINDQGDKFYSRILSKIDEGVRALGKAENYVVILDSDPKASTTVLYFAPSLDITEKITTHLNSK